jgi:1-phosphatidylinositol-4-phosphate 5-kinase
MQKRAKQQQEAEAALTRPQPKDDGNGVLVGNLIGEDHVNYVLMYNMLTGIRIGVSFCLSRSQLLFWSFIANYNIIY